MLAADDGKADTVASIHAVHVRSHGQVYDSMFPVVEAAYHARGGKSRKLAGNDGLILKGRADVRLSIDAAGELYLYSKGDGIIRKVVGAAGF
jgi:hypothetical protein